MTTDLEMYVRNDELSYKENKEQIRNLIEKFGKISYEVVEERDYDYTSGKYRKQISNTKRLFIGTNGIGYFPKGCRHNGYVLETSQVVSIKPIIKKARKTEEQKQIDHVKKVMSYCKASGLWKDLVFTGNLILAVGIELSNKCSKAYWEDELYKSDKETEEEYRIRADKVLKGYEELATTVINRIRKFADKETVDKVENYLMKTEKVTINTKNGYKYRYLDDSFDGRYTYHEVFSLLHDFDMLAKHPIKSMTFHHSKYYAERTEQARQRIKECIEKKESCRESGRNSYDVSFEYNAELGRAWYSECYITCGGNGHYYLALDHQHALFCEND